jgi:hypothetical protein
MCQLGQQHLAYDPDNARSSIDGKVLFQSIACGIQAHRDPSDLKKQAGKEWDYAIISSYSKINRAMVLLFRNGELEEKIPQ